MNKIRAFLLAEDTQKLLIVFLPLLGVLLGGCISLLGTFTTERLQKQQLVFTQEIASIKAFNGGLGFPSSEVISQIQTLNGNIGVLLSHTDIELSEVERVIQESNSVAAKAMKWTTDLENEAEVLEILTGEKGPNLSLSYLGPTIENAQDAKNRRHY